MTAASPGPALNVGGGRQASMGDVIRLLGELEVTAARQVTGRGAAG